MYKNCSTSDWRAIILDCFICEIFYLIFRMRVVQGIFSMLCGFLIYSWKGYNTIDSGHCCVPMKLQVWLIAGEIRRNQKWLLWGSVIWHGQALHESVGQALFLTCYSNNARVNLNLVIDCVVDKITIFWISTIILSLTFWHETNVMLFYDSFIQSNIYTFVNMFWCP
jgi:hypothetical protein